jgi:hypothetical protein
MTIKRKGSQPAFKGSPDNFTGNVHVEPLFQAPGARLTPCRRSRPSAFWQRTETLTAENSSASRSP